MGHPFDPLHTWLGIPVEDQPPHHYRLLGLEPREADREVILNAVNQRTAHVKSKLSGPHAQQARDLLAKITSARICLLSPDKKEDYDTALRHGMGKAASADTAAAQPRIKTAQPLPTARPLAAEQAPASTKRQPKKAAKSAAAPVVAATPVSDGTPAQAVRQPRFKGDPEPAEAAPATPGPQIVAEGSARYRPRRRSSWLMPVALLLLVAVAGGAAAAAYYMGFIPFGEPRVAANSQGPADAGGSDEAVAGESDAAMSEMSDMSDTSDGSDGSDGSDMSDSSDASDTPDAPDGFGPEEAAAVPDPGDLDELTDEPWAGLFDDKPSAEKPPAGEMADGEAADDESPAADANPNATANAHPPGSQRWPVPSQEEQEKTRAAVRRIFYDDIASAKTSEQRVELAQKLIAYAEQTKNDPAARYTLLALARDLAAHAGESLLILNTVDQLAKEYEVEPLKMKADAIQLAGRSAPSAQALGGVMETARQLIADAVRESQYDLAVELGEMCLTSARRLRSRQLVTECSVLLKDINTRKVRYDYAQRATETLQTNPEDPDANLALGRYLVITDRNWKRGLPHLAKGSDERLAEAANLELSQPADPQAKIALAELWEKLAVASRGEEEEPLYRRRSIHWLQQALPQLEGLEKIATAKKLEELGAAVDLTAAVPAEVPKDDGLSTIEERPKDKPSDADLLDALSDEPAARPPAKDESAKPPAAAPKAVETQPQPPAVPPVTPPGESVEDFFGPRPPKPEDDDSGSDFFDSSE